MMRTWSLAALGRTALAIIALSLGDTCSVAATTIKSELDGKIITGYQGWFGCPGDGGSDTYTHWQRPDGGLNVDLLPDLSELPPNNTCDFKPAEGIAAVSVYSALNPAIIDMHFRWMTEYRIDIAAVQRFISVVKSPTRLTYSNRQLNQIREASERHNRQFFVEYDLSGSKPDDLPLIQQDVARVVADVGQSPAYVRLLGRPLIGLWGLGFAGRAWTPSAAEGLLAAIRQSKVSVMVGVPAYWRSLDRDADSDPAWLRVWPLTDVLSPWTVGRFGDKAGVERYKADVLALDLLWTDQKGIIYLPTVFPGFSWSNMHKGERARNEIPRRCGAFLREQLESIRALGIPRLFVAMFDEVDEGTAVFKLLTHRPYNDVLTLDADGCETTSDLYLRILRDIDRISGK